MIKQSKLSVLVFLYKKLSCQLLRNAHCTCLYNRYQADHVFMLEQILSMKKTSSSATLLNMTNAEGGKRIVIFKSEGYF